MKKYLLIGIAVFLVFGAFYGFMLYNKPHRNITTEKARFDMSADELIAAFAMNEQRALNKFNGQVVAFHGKLAEVSTNDEGVHYAIVKGTDGLLNCEVDGNAFGVLQKSPQGTFVALKGLFVGYDELLGEVQFKKCTLANQ